MRLKLLEEFKEQVEHVNALSIDSRCNDKLICHFNCIAEYNEVDFQ